MTIREEMKLREAFATLIPDAPPSIGDPAPVVRRARRQRTRTALTGGALALVAASTIAVPLWLGRGADGGPEFAVDQARDPFTELPCDGAPAMSEGFEPAQVVAARLCDHDPVPEFRIAAAPADALVTGLDGWRARLDSVKAADPGRCAAVDVVSTQLRLLVEYADGSTRVVDAGICGNVDLGDRMVDGADVAEVFLASLATQREELGPPKAAAPRAGCDGTDTLDVPTEALAPPLVAVQCPGSGKGPRREMDSARLAMLADDFASGSRGGSTVACGTADVGWALVTVDAFGDVISWAPSNCGQALVSIGGARPPERTWTVPFEFAD